MQHRREAENRRLNEQNLGYRDLTPAEKRTIAGIWSFDDLMVIGLHSMFKYTRFKFVMKRDAIHAARRLRNQSDW